MTSGASAKPQRLLRRGSTTVYKRSLTVLVR